jgi:hypothetical protein
MNIDPRLLLLQASHIGIFTITFFLESFEAMKFLNNEKYSEFILVKLLGSREFYIWRYIMYNLVMFTSS